mgnify:CR=1 FL=1
MELGCIGVPAISTNMTAGTSLDDVHVARESGIIHFQGLEHLSI